MNRVSVSTKTLQSDGETLPRLMELQQDGKLLLEFDERYPTLGMSITES